jgi:hypothetical protein
MKKTTLYLLGFVVVILILGFIDARFNPISPEMQRELDHPTVAEKPPTSAELRDNSLLYEQGLAEALTRDAAQLVEQDRPNAAKEMYEKRRDYLKAAIVQLGQSTRLTDDDKQRVIGALQTELNGVEVVIVAKHFIYQ